MSRTRLSFQQLQAACCAVLCCAAVSAGAAPDASLLDMTMTSGEWMLRLDRWGHEPTTRLDLRSNGDVQRSRGRKSAGGGWQPAGPDWGGAFSGRVPPTDVNKVYEAARLFIQAVKPADLSRAGDFDAGYEITIVTGHGSYHVWFVGTELYEDKVLREGLTRLVDAINEGLPHSARLGRVYGG